MCPGGPRYQDLYHSVSSRVRSQMHSGSGLIRLRGTGVSNPSTYVGSARALAFTRSCDRGIGARWRSPAQTRPVDGADRSKVAVACGSRHATIQHPASPSRVSAGPSPTGSWAHCDC